jgi:hypothetical protein
MSMQKLHAALVVAAAAILAGCGGTMPTLGGGGTVATGGAGGSTAQGASSQLEHCGESLGTLAVTEDRSAGWYGYLSQYKLGSTIPVLRMIVQQSNCFVVVDRAGGIDNAMRERSLARSGEARAGSNFGKGQVVAADYTMSPSITFSEKGTGGIGGLLSAFGARTAGTIAGGLKSNEASTTLLVVDNRSAVQLASAVGSASNFDFDFAGGIFTSGSSGQLGAYGNTPEGKVLVAAFMDAYNQVVRAVRNYRAQTVRGGLGTGGRLGVDGGSTPASRGR